MSGDRVDDDLRNIVMDLTLGRTKLKAHISENMSDASQSDESSIKEVKQPKSTPGTPLDLGGKSDPQPNTLLSLLHEAMGKRTRVESGVKDASDDARSRAIKNSDVGLVGEMLKKLLH